MAVRGNAIEAGRYGSFDGLILSGYRARPMPFKGLLRNLSGPNPEFFEAKRGPPIYLLEPNAVVPQSLKDSGESGRNVVGRGNAFRLRGIKSRIQIR
jgi:hypothetical protein